MCERLLPSLGFQGTKMGLGRVCHVSKQRPEPRGLPKPQKYVK